MGVRTMAAGEPIAVPVFDGHSAAPRTGPAQVERLRPRVGITDVVGVRDRGMVKTTGQAALATAGDQDITALTTPQGRQFRRAGVGRPAWCTPHVHEGPDGSGRQGLRRREAIWRQAQRRRHDTRATRHSWITARQAVGQTAARAPPDAGLRMRHAWGTPTSWQAGCSGHGRRVPSSPRWMRAPQTAGRCRSDRGLPQPGVEATSGARPRPGVACG